METYVGYADGASRSLQNLSSTTWAIFNPNGELVSFRGVCIGQSTNNIAEYSALIELLSDAITRGIRRLIVRLDSQLVVLQLNGIYSVRNPAIYRMFLRVKIFLEGDLVLLYDQESDKLGAGKFNSLWMGPYIVKRVLAKGAYELIDYDGIPLAQPRNGLYLKRYYA